MPKLNAKQVDAFFTELNRLNAYVEKENAAYQAYRQARARRTTYAEKMHQKRGRLLETMAKQRTPRGNRGAAMHAAYAARRAAAETEEFLGYATWADGLLAVQDLQPLADAIDATRETLFWLDTVAQE